MNQNDYVILFDENGSPYIAHAGLIDRARGAVNAAANRVQQVANQAKGVGRGVRQNHKYILKVNENGKTRYFYKQEEVKAYYEAKKRGIKNAAEYAQNAVKNKATEVADKAKQGVSNAKNAVRDVASDAKDAASTAYNKAKDSANNTVTNAKNKFEQMKSEFRDKTGQTLKDRAETTKQEAQKAETERQKAAGKYSADVNAALKSEKNLNANPNSAYAQAERDRTINELRKSSEEYYKDGGALDTAQKKRNEAAEASREYTDFKKNNSAQAMIDRAKTTIKDKAEDLSAKAKSTAQAAKESAHGMIENARSSTAKAVNEAWDKIPKNADGTVNPFDSNFQSAYNDWKSKKDKYDGSLTGQAKAVAEKATDSVKDMIDQAKKAAKNTATSAQNALDNATGESYRKQAQEANRAAEHAMNELFRTSDQLENQRSKYGSQHNDSEHIYGDSEGYYYKTEAQRDIAENMIKRRDQYSADVVNNNRTSNTLDNRYANTKAGQLNKLLGRDTSSTSSRTNGAADAIKAVWNLEDAKSRLVGGHIEPDTNVSKEYVYSRASNSGMAGQVSKVMKLEEAMRNAERAYERLGEDSSKPQSSSRAARTKMLDAQKAYNEAYEELIDDINKQYDRDLAAYEKQYGKYNR